MNTKDIEKDMVSIYHLLTGIEKRDVDNVIRNYALSSCLKLQNQVYQNLSQAGVTLRAIDFSKIQPSKGDILYNQEYLLRVLNTVEIDCREIEKARSKFICKK